MTPLTTIIEEEKKEAHKLMQNGRYYGQTKAGDCMAGFYTEEDMGTILINTIQRVAKAMREEERDRMAQIIVDVIELDKSCHHPEHNPASMKFREAGMYKHICPSCGEEQVFEVPLVTL